MSGIDHIRSLVGTINDLFSEGAANKIGKGHMTSFWIDPWVVGEPRQGSVPKNISSLVGLSVTKCGV
jgi:hypothetical protein